MSKTKRTGIKSSLVLSSRVGMLAKETIKEVRMTLKIRIKKNLSL